MSVRIRIRLSGSRLATACPALRATVLAAALAVLLPLAPAAVSAGQPSPAARIAELQRAGRVTEALALCRQENAAHPGDAVMLYNQACLENRAGNAAAAVACLRAALAAGFDDLAFAEEDPDLQGAARDGARAAIDEARRQRQDLAAWRGARLAVGKPVTLPLAAPAGGTTGGTLTLTWVATGLDLRLDVDDAGGRFLPAEGASPWAGKGGVVVALGDLREKEGVTGDVFLFAFGTEKDAGVGSLFVVETGRWQRVRELQPKFRGAGTAHLVMDASIPWSAISPYHPLTERVLGLDAVVVGADGSPGPGLTGRRLWQQPDARAIGAARLDFDLASVPAGALEGRTPTAIVTTRTMALNLVATAATAGEGSLTIDFRDGQGNSLLADGAKAEAVALVAGVNAINRAVDFGKVHRGPCRIEATLSLPSGLQASWSTWLLNLGPDWEQAYRTAIAKLPPAEQPTGEYYLAAVADAVSRHRARRHPGALTTTLGDLNLMLARFKQTGSLVPAEGSTPFVYPGPGGSDRLCQIVVPAGRPAGTPLAPVVLAGHVPEDGPRLAARILRYLEKESPRAGAAAKDGPTPAAWPVYVVADGEDPSRDGSALAELRACLQWATKRFDARAVSLVAQHGAVAPALAMMRDRDIRIDRLLLFADETLAPWPNADAAELDRRVGPSPGSPDLTWVDFEQETGVGGQGRALRAALARLGWPVRDVKVRGGSNYTQVADRACMWQAAAAGRDGGR